ncbi:MAG: tRNA (cytidine(34)-2'-O)-methyltransferase [Candidatus Sericytochromatia bacterium]|nr:tRNA (cytidine(34)-2'-O)-methyltransferase [Candidatus Tanganyikabacteria bacterium]
MDDRLFHIVLWEPEIPPNTGNVARLCAALGLPLHLVGPLGFRVSDREVRRAGLDYWESVDLRVYPNRQAFEAANPAAPAWYFSTRGERTFWDAAYSPGDYLIFGSETRGLPHDLLDDDPDRVVRIPHGPAVRSLNLANSVAIGVYEALRQNRDRAEWRSGK